MEDLSVVKYYNTSLSEFGFLSHLPLLMAACSLTSGPVLELGTGFGSTFALHGLCATQKRMMVSLESDKVWLGAFNFYRRKWHIFRHVNSFMDLPEYQQEWGLAFIDHGILGQRGIALSSLKHVPIIVAHDTCYEELNYHNNSIPDPLGQFKYRFDYHWQGPMTSVLSNSIDVKMIFKEFEI